jgi:membrane-associated phospholipid phosphatase
MNPYIPIALGVACIIMIIIERMGAPTTLILSFRGDVKRETRFLAQYGQGVCTAITAALIWQLDSNPAHQAMILPMFLAVFLASAFAFLIKRLAGRMRPKHPNAGKFLGPSLKHDNARESFPSSHSACAMALSVFLVYFYRDAQPGHDPSWIFWTLALTTAGLRYVLDAHWPSDVIGGIALGYSTAWLVIELTLKFNSRR